MKELVEQLKQQIVEGLMLEEVTVDDIDCEAPLFGDGLGLDSIDALELVVLLENQYGLKISDMEVGKKVFESINSMAEFIMNSRK